LEGTVICDPYGIWEDSDSAVHKIKLKLEIQVELRIKGFKAADPKSKNAKTFGSIETESECGKLKASVSGIKDKDRLWMHQHRDQLLDGIITVKANGITPPPEGGGFFSLFLPRFIEIRLDKNEADTLVNIQQIEQAAISLGAIYGKTN
jgi:DNA ligase-1